VQNYLVKCINSSFADKFVYLPTHQHGLIIGGKRPASSSDDHKSKATLWQIEYEGLVVEHCQITFLDENMVYVL
jgi:hypothetical protein